MRINIRPNGEYTFARLVEGMNFIPAFGVDPIVDPRHGSFALDDDPPCFTATYELWVSRIWHARWGFVQYPSRPQIAHDHMPFADGFLSLGVSGAFVTRHFVGNHRAIECKVMDTAVAFG